MGWPRVRPGVASGFTSLLRGRWSLKQSLAGIFLVLLAGAGGLYGIYWWKTGRYLVTTDDAYVQAHSVLVSPRVSGYISEVPVDDNQPVHAGDVLARIDSRDYRANLERARANVAAAQASVDTLRQQIGQQRLLVRQAHQLVVSDQAALNYAQQNFDRYTKMSSTGAASVQQAQQAVANFRQTAASLKRDTDGVKAASKQIAIYKAELAQAKATLLQQQAIERTAGLMLGYTIIRSSVDGTVGVRTVRVGEYVQPGTQLMAVVPLQAVYVVANYKETELTDVRPGQPVEIEVDTFPDAKVHGTVDSIAAASGEEFALLPPDNATGNFTKIVQRIPVKILIDRSDPLFGRLRPGMSVEPTINTKPSTSGAQRSRSL
jgi:membrane fusion protein, multidrug efflux system